jgi:hypothetical protein
MTDDLFAWAERERPGDPRLVREFLAFHRENPHIYDLVCRFARTAQEAGFRCYGIAAIFERVRWHVTVERREEWKMNNNYRAFYARLWLHDHPDWPGFFETRRSCADGIEARA